MSVEARLDIKDFLPEEISPAQNGILMPNQLRKIHCGGKLYIDAARSWLAMVRAASIDGIFLNLNNPVNAYRSMVTQRKLFLERFVPVDDRNSLPPDAVCAEFDNKLWRLNSSSEFVEVPGQSSYGFGLAVRIMNGANAAVKAWLDENAGQFGFVREFDSIPQRFVYIRSRDEIPDRVLEIEKLPPEPKYSAEQIEQHGDGKWLKPPPDNWFCNGMFSSAPFRAGALAVIDQGEGVGIDDKTLANIFRQCAGFICVKPTENLIKRNRPILVTSNVKDTIEKLNAFFAEAATESAIEKPPVVDVEALQKELRFHRKTNPEAVIFQRKKDLSERLLKLSANELRNATEQPWYEEYLALLEVRLKEPALCFLAKKYVAELLRRHSELSPKDERELAVLGLLQFLEPTELPVPFNQHLWSKEMIIDVKGIFLGNYTRLCYMDDDLATYWIAQQSKWRHGKRKMRVVFLMSSSNKGDKLIPVYDAMRERDDIEVFMVLYPSADSKYSDKFYNYFREHYPNDKIYDGFSLMDLRKLKPDYVFRAYPYEHRSPFPSLTSNDIVKFAKLVNINYAELLAYNYLDRQLDLFPHFYRLIYFLFASSETAKDEVTKRFSENVDLGYQHFEFLGYPVLDGAGKLKADEHSTKNILWTPRWSYDARLGGSHFLEYKDKFIGLRERYGDKVELSMRPHMATFRFLQAQGLISKAEVAAYKKRLKANSIELYSTFVDLEENFRNMDILLSDYSSILIVWFLTGRPIVYCEFKNAVMLPDYQEMLECMYIARSWEDVERYLDDLVAGNDPLFERRQKEVARLRAFHDGAIERIVNRMLEDFNAGLAE